jgi:hypothetical protein
MMRCTVWFLGVTLAFVAILGVAPAALASGPGEADRDGWAAAGSSQATILEHLTDMGSAIRLGFGVSPLPGQFGPSASATPGAYAGESGRSLDLDSRGRTVSFELELAWPGAARTGLQPYVALGPALFVVEPDDAGRLLGTRADPIFHLGAKAAAGVNWQLGKHATLFGAYEIMAAPRGGFTAAGARAPADPGVGGYDFTYGIRFLY